MPITRRWRNQLFAAYARAARVRILASVVGATG